MLQLGPINGWRCARERVYIYAPNRTWFDGGLLRERPEDVVRATNAALEVERVEIDLLTSEAIIWTRIEGESGRVFVLAPGRLTVIVDPESHDMRPICATAMSDWRIIGEHRVG